MSTDGQVTEPIADTVPVETTSLPTDGGDGGGGASQVQQTLAVRDLISQSGMNAADFNDDQEAVQALIGAVQEFRQYRPFIQQGQEYRQLQADKDFQAWMQQRRQAAQPQQAQPAQAPPKWSMPKYDPSWELLTRWEPQLGRYVVIDPVNVSPTVAEARNAYHQAQRENLNRLLENPTDTIWGAGLEEKINAALQKQMEQVQAMLTQYDTVKYNQSYLEQNKQYFYNLDANGQPLYDTNGNESLTDMGKFALQSAMQARQFGIQHSLQIQQYVDQQLFLANKAGMFGTSKPAQATQPVHTPEAIAEDKKKSFVQRATRSKNRNGTQHPGAAPTDDLPPQNLEASFRELNREELRKRGVLPQTG